MCFKNFLSTECRSNPPAPGFLKLLIAFIFDIESLKNAYQPAKIKASLQSEQKESTDSEEMGPASKALGSIVPPPPHG